MKNLIFLFAALTVFACASEPIKLPEQSLHSPAVPESEPDNWQELLPQQLEEVRAAVEPYKDFKKAKQDGWKAFGGDGPLMGRHYYLKPKDRTDYVAGDAIDFSKPSNLMYTEINGEMVLTGVAFVVRLGSDESVPAGFAGPEDVWHVHNVIDLLNAATEERPFIRGVAKRRLEKQNLQKGDDRHRLAMVHVWTEAKNPDGVFAHHDRSLPYRKLNLSADWAEGASMASANGLGLATKNGCKENIRGKAWIVDLSRKQTKQLYARCESIVERINQSLQKQDLGKDELNDVAERAWNDFDAFKNTVYTAEQKRRAESLMETGGLPGHHH